MNTLQITKDETQEKWFLTESYDEKYEQPVIDVTSINDDCFATFWSGANKGDAISDKTKLRAVIASKAPEMLEMISELLKELEFHGYRHSTTIYNAQNLIKEATEIK